MAAMRDVLRTIGALLLCGLLLAPELAAAQSVPDFSDSLVASVADPTALAFLNSGPASDPHMLLTSQSGQLWYLASGTSNPVEVDLALAIGNCLNGSGGETGLLGVAVHPALPYVYLFYTHDAGQSCENRVVRYTLTPGNPPTLTDEQVLLRGMRVGKGNHNGGDLQFGRDNLLYISVGDDGIGANGQRLHNLRGKIVRLDGNGAIPAGNAFTGPNSVRCNDGPAAAGKRCKEIYAYGLRNPFRIAINRDPTGPALFINDVGGQKWEEVNWGVLGANYGWPRREGPCAQGKDNGKSCRGKPKGLKNPVFAYRHRSGCRSITGGAFVPRASSWPEAYQGDYLFADFICGKMFRLDNVSGKEPRRSLFTEFGPFSVVHLAFGPDNNTLYYLTRSNGGELHRIVPIPAP